MTYLVTGAAGFIGFHLCQTLLQSTAKIIGIDNLNAYYDVNLKNARLAQLKAQPNFQFYAIDITDRKALETLFKENPSITHIVHLAAQAGVRYSLTHPFAYLEANVVGHLAILEAARHLPHLQHLLYASSSSVYGGNDKLPFSVHDPINKPLSLYAATKCASELMSYTYSHLYGLPITGLRYFTVYGPWGRPDMAAFIFTKSILENKTISLFNFGEMKRNFTYIDDIIAGTIACLHYYPKKSAGPSQPAPHRIYNIGNNRSESLLTFVQLLEQHLGKKALIELKPMQPGEVPETVADISESTEDFGFQPKTCIEAGLLDFVTWYKQFYAV